MNKYRRIKYEDRCQIYALSKRGSSQESIAEVLGVSQSAVSREIHRNRGERGYRFKQAEAKAQARQAHCLRCGFSEMVFSGSTRFQHATERARSVHASDG